MPFRPAGHTNLNLSPQMLQNSSLSDPHYTLQAHQSPPPSSLPPKFSPVTISGDKLSSISDKNQPWRGNLNTPSEYPVEKLPGGGDGLSPAAGTTSADDLPPAELSPMGLSCDLFATDPPTDYPHTRSDNHNHNLMVYKYLPLKS